MIIPIGVTTKKNITPMTKGETILPKNIPNLNQTLLRGVKIGDLSNPNIRNIIDVIKAHNLISSLLINGYKAIRRKKIKKTIPKLLLEPILASKFFMISIYCKYYYKLY